MGARGMTSNGDKLAFECRGMMIQMGEKPAVYGRFFRGRA